MSGLTASAGRVGLPAWLSRLLRLPDLIGDHGRRMAAGDAMRPHGRWRCTHAAPWVHGFEVGGIYVCGPDPAGGSPRIRPKPNIGWAPYWEAHSGRFCYPADELDFEFVEPSNPR